MKSLLSTYLMVFVMASTGWAQSCLPEGIVYTTQSSLDSFPILYPGCTHIEGSLAVRGISIQNILPLTGLKSVGGDLTVTLTFDMVNLKGLDSLQSVGGSLTILENQSLESIEALKNLNTIGGSLAIFGSWRLESLQPLIYVDSIGGRLDVVSTGVSSLTGLDNIAPETIDSLGIAFNPYLSECNVPSICAFLADPRGLLEIGSNSPGCNSIEEILEACSMTRTSSLYRETGIAIFPNPASDFLGIKSTRGHEAVYAMLYNQFGQRIQALYFEDKKADISFLSRGVYFLELEVGGRKWMEKLLIR